MVRRLDEVDKRILYHLVRDARNTTAPDVAEEVNVSPGTIRNRIERMEEDGILEGYHAQIDYERVEGRLMNLFICIAPVPDRERLAQQALTVSGVVHVREIMTGESSLHIKAVGEDTADLTRIARELTDLGLTVTDEHLVQREHHRPYRPFGPEGEEEPSEVAGFVSLTGGAELVDVTVREGAPIDGRTLVEATEEGIIGPNVLVVAIERDDETVTARGDTEIRSNDQVTVYSRGGIGDETLAAFGAA